MNIFILRHGIAVERGTPGYKRDAERPLTAKGERRLWLAGEAMEALELSFDVILSSPYVRARQTTEIVADALGAKKKCKVAPDLTPDGSFKKLVEFINALRPKPENVLLVGHEPHLSGLIAFLTTGREMPAVVLRKGGLARLSAESLQPGRCAVLEWLLTPKQMALMC
jgi:phosphohistidine phosphatase